MAQTFHCLMESFRRGRAHGAPLTNLGASAIAVVFAVGIRTRLLIGKKAAGISSVATLWVTSEWSHEHAARSFWRRMATHVEHPELR